MLKTDTQALVDNKSESVRNLYDRYAGMLLGYIFEVVRDSELAEKYLVQVFCELSEQFKDQNWQGPQNWCQLQRFTQLKIAGFAEDSRSSEKPFTSGLIVHSSGDKYLELLTGAQKRIFLDIYYHGKTTAVLSVELNKSEEFIRKTLKEAFAILRKIGEN
jgi:hypothetical protein